MQQYNLCFFMFYINQYQNELKNCFMYMNICKIDGVFRIQYTKRKDSYYLQLDTNIEQLNDIP